MRTHGPAFYDDDTIFATYMAHRQQPDNPPDTLEQPVLLDLVGTVAGLRILDLHVERRSLGVRRWNRAAGCTSAWKAHTTWSWRHGRRLPGRPARLSVQPSRPGTTQTLFDLAISRLVLHYIEDFAAVCANVYQALAHDGRFIFSVEHPILTSCERSWQSVGSRHDRIVDNYFAGGPRITAWLGER